MTIAACYVSPEGVVLGADSTASANTPEGLHYFNHSQKLFEIGQNSTLGIVAWGLGGLDILSHRLLVARLSDDLASSPAKTVSEVADRWVTKFWNAYTNSAYGALIIEGQVLNKKKPFDPSAATTDSDARSDQEEYRLAEIRNKISVGFCIAGYVLPDRTPAAVEIVFDPAGDKPTPTPISTHSARLYGAPNIMMRLIRGIDERLFQDIVNSNKWTGTEQELRALVSNYALKLPAVLPIRDAVDYVNISILSTIKALKFSSMSQICGGPIEIAVITADRNFRWVRHKEWDAAIVEGDS